MPKGYRISDVSKDEAVFAAQQAGETIASIADRLGINRWNVSADCTRIRSRRRLESRRAEFADWRDVPIAYSGLSTRAQDTIRAMRIATMGALYVAIENEGAGLFKYVPNVGRITAGEIFAWYNAKLGELPSPRGAKVGCRDFDAQQFIICNFFIPRSKLMVLTRQISRIFRFFDKPGSVCRDFVLQKLNIGRNRTHLPVNRLIGLLRATNVDGRRGEES